MSSTTPSEPVAAPRIAVIARVDDPVVAEFVGAFDRDAVALSVHETSTVDAARAAIRAAVEGGVDAIAAVGGDGALSVALSTVAEERSHVPVVPVRAGTVNLMAQVLDLPTPADAARSVLDRRVTAIDLGETQHGWFCLNTSTGFDAATIADADDHSDARFGRLRFAVAGLRRLRSHSPRHVAVNVDGDDVYVGRAMSVVVLNAGQRVTDGFDVAPDASLTDGLLDVAVVRVATLRRLVRTIALLAAGRPVPDGDIVRDQGRRIEIDWRRPVPCQRDGDPVGSVTSQVLVARPRAVRIHHGPGSTVRSSAPLRQGVVKMADDP